MAEYAGMSLLDVGGLDYLDFLVLRRDAYIYMLSRTPEGRKYLDNAWRMEQTEPDRAGLRKKLGRKEAELHG